MFSHVMVGTNDVDASRVFYDAIFGALGVSLTFADVKRNRLLYKSSTGMLSVTKPIDGNAATVANGGTIGFACDSSEQVDKWHEAGITNGGTTCEDPPGIRPSGLYLAYLRDPSGNKLCALYRAA